ncbi:hypothetical protein NX784_18465 [Massilia pinisoli]|uniref:Uncharacterized protein n=1 Tax=Massilia pinisoli TaxID=1772194 RepID=A0ABT1ZVC5_9BURK|nr:hypothetical protein [Massilia pinisoli]MCS0583579.1 hypothetical protein [Massilia pinisoli]
MELFAIGISVKIIAHAATVRAFPLLPFKPIRVCRAWRNGKDIQSVTGVGAQVADYSGNTGDLACSTTIDVSADRDGLARGMFRLSAGAYADNFASSSVTGPWSWPSPGMPERSSGSYGRQFAEPTTVGFSTFLFPYIRGGAWDRQQCLRTSFRTVSNG